MKNVSRKTWSLFIPYMTKNLIALRRSNLQSEIIRDTNFTKHVRIMFFFAHLMECISVMLKNHTSKVFNLKVNNYFTGRHLQFISGIFVVQVYFFRK